MKDNTLDIFSILRAVAMLCIFGLHAVIIIGPYLPPHTRFPFFLFSPAWAAVWMLFSLSGFLLGRNFFAGKYDDWASIKSFYINRFIRVGIPYYLLLLFVCLFCDPIGFSSLHLSDFIRLLTFTFNGRPRSGPVEGTWFISTIMQFYLLAPVFYHLIFKRISRSSTWVIMVGLLVTGWVVRHLLFWHHLDWHTWIYTFSPVSLDTFFVPFLLNAYAAQLPLRSSSITCWRVVCLSLLTVGLVLCTLFVYNGEHAILYYYTFPTLFTVIMTCICLTFWNTRRSQAPQVVLSIKQIAVQPLLLLEAFSVITYSFYLYHVYVLPVIPRILKAHHIIITGPAFCWVTVGGGFVLCTLWAIIMYMMVERPLNGWRKKITASQKI